MKKHFNRTVFCLVLLLLIAILAAGCTQPSQDASEGTGESSKNVTESNNTDHTESNGKTEATGNTSESKDTPDKSNENTEETKGNTAWWEQHKTVLSEPVTQYVQVDDSKTVTYKPELSAQEITIPVSIPKLLSFSKDATAYQAEIEDDLEFELTLISEAVTHKTNPSYLYIKFDAYLNNDILSIMVECCSTVDLNSYYTYNFDVTTGKKLDTAALMEKIQFADYEEKLTQAAKTAFESKWGSNGTGDLYKEQFNNTIDPKNIEAAMPYLDQDGKLKAVIDIFSLAGASRYAEILPLA